MSEPIVFISHFRVKDGNLDAIGDLARDVTDRLRVEKPQTLLYLSFVDEAGATISFLHAFADAESLDLHNEGADQRSRAAFELVEPTGWEIYGRPSNAALDVFRRAAERAGVPLTVQRDFVAGFLRLASD
jgi:quinol monooxygenase YgiN